MFSVTVIKMLKTNEIAKLITELCLDQFSLVYKAQKYRQRREHGRHVEHLVSKAAGNKGAERPFGVAVSLELCLLLCACLKDELCVRLLASLSEQHIYLSVLDFLGGIF